jgi:hypothetical protein
MGNESGGTKLGQWLTVVIVLIGIVILVGLVLPSFITVRGHGSREAEAKANLHNLQLSIERYAVDNNGDYPAYLIGGEPKYAAQVDLAQSSGWDAFAQISDCDVTQVSDPLLRAGYIDAYPRNPFVRDGMAVHRVQEDLPTSITGNDPLRNGAPEAKLLGTRFGPYCTAMGQVLCDPRYTQWQYQSPATGKAEPRDTWATVEYRMWDMWQSGRRGQEPWLAIAPGQFFYKSDGIYVLSDANHTGIDQPLRPVTVDGYMLGVYGGLRTRGKDIIGDEEACEYFSSADGESIPTIRCIFWPWTRSQCGSTSRQGSPYGNSASAQSNRQTQYGRPNGINDGVVLVLTAGEDWQGS